MKTFVVIYQEKKNKEVSHRCKILKNNKHFAIQFLNTYLHRELIKFVYSRCYLLDGFFLLVP